MPMETIAAFFGAEHGWVSIFAEVGECIGDDLISSIEHFSSCLPRPPNQMKPELQSTATDETPISNLLTY